MKISLLVLFVIVASSAFATIHSVSNVDTSAQFFTIQAACDASQSGDSIYVLASPTNYDGFTINNKKLAVFGPGWSPFTGGTAIINGDQFGTACTLTGTGASGSELQGLIFYGAIRIENSNINDLIFYRNRLYTILFANGQSENNYRFEGNWFVDGGQGYPAGIFGSSLSNSVIRNNLFFGGALRYMTGNNVILYHNLFYGRQSDFFQTSHLILSNNIIQIDVSGTSFSTFNNNITYNAGNNTPWNTNNNIDAGGNIANTNPQMADEASVDADVNYPLLNFTIAQGPGNNSGSDGKDMGLLFDKGGVTNWSNSRAAHLPYITGFTITNQNIFTGGYIYFNVSAKSN